MKISIRVNGQTTSVRISPNILAVYCAVLLEDDSNPINYMVDEVYKIVKRWNKQNNKGLSDFISASLLREILDQDVVEEYDHLIGVFNTVKKA